jgi:hypothetical protein
VARAGRDLELLVAELERLLGSTRSQIESPDYIVGRSGQRREVDVSVRATVGSSEFLVMFECRDRRDRQGIDWIEQLATKARDVRADRTIAVSSSGFSDGARQTAEREDIALRSIEELAVDGIFSWLHPEFEVEPAMMQCWARVGVQINIESESEGLLPADTLDTPNIRLDSGEEVPIGAFVDLLIEKDVSHGPDPWAGLEPEQPRVQRGTTLQRATPEERLQVETSRGWLDVFSIDVLYEVWLESRPTRRRSLRYTDEGGVLAEVLELETELDGTTVSFFLTRPLDATPSPSDEIPLRSSVVLRRNMAAGGSGGAPRGPS